MPLVEFEPTISAGERSQTHALDRAASGTGKNNCVGRVKLLVVIWKIDWKLKTESLHHHLKQVSNCCLTCYTGCPRRNRQNFGRMFLMSKYTDITQNTYIQS